MVVGAYAGDPPDLQATSRVGHVVVDVAACSGAIFVKLSQMMMPKESVFDSLVEEVELCDSR